MAGHNKWSKVKRQKGVTDAKKAKVFAKLAREIGIAVRVGGPEADLNKIFQTRELMLDESGELTETYPLQACRRRGVRRSRPVG